MDRTQTTSGEPLFVDPVDFSLCLGGPLYQLWRRMRLTGDTLQLLNRRIGRNELDAIEMYGHNPTGGCHTTHAFGAPKGSDGKLTHVEYGPEIDGFDMHFDYAISMTLYVLHEIAAHFKKDVAEIESLQTRNRELAGEAKQSVQSDCREDAAPG